MVNDINGRELVEQPGGGLGPVADTGGGSADNFYAPTAGGGYDASDGEESFSMPSGFPSHAEAMQTELGHELILTYGVAAHEIMAKGAAALAEIENKVPFSMIAAAEALPASERAALIVALSDLMQSAPSPTRTNTTTQRQPSMSNTQTDRLRERLDDLVREQSEARMNGQDHKAKRLQNEIQRVSEQISPAPAPGSIYEGPSLGGFGDSH